MKDVQSYDAVVIGAGQGAIPLARALAAAGRKTCLIEREHVGGTCINEGCTPTKTMVASARVAYLARRASDYGVTTGPVTVAMPRVRDRKRKIVEQFRTGSQRRLEQTPGLTLLFGEAAFVSSKMLDVRLNAGGTVTLSAETIVINTGARPSFPSIPGLDRIPTLTSTSIMELETVPPHLLVLGGGYVGVEFAQMFRRFGSAVTIIQDGPQLLTKEDPDVSEEISKILREDGIDIVVGARVERAELVANGLVQLTFGVGTGTDAQRVTGSHLLVATGRTPNTDRLNLAAADIHASSEGLIEVNDQLATNVPGVYAIGDVTGEPAFTHISYDDYRILKTNLLEGGHASTRGRLIPYTIYIDPQLGRVGLTETEARKQDQPIAVAKLPMNRVARAVEVDEPRGFMKAIVNSKTQQILGVAVLGIEGGELMSMFEVAMLGHLPYPVLREAIFAHPTLAESLNNLFARVG